MNKSDRHEVVKIIKNALIKAYMYAQVHSLKGVYTGKCDLQDVITAIETEPEELVAVEEDKVIGDYKKEIEYYKGVIDKLEDKIEEILNQTSMELERWKKGARKLALHVPLPMSLNGDEARMRKLSNISGLSVDELFHEPQTCEQLSKKISDGFEAAKKQLKKEE